MADAILSLRTSGDEGVWLDKLCINQSDESEKAIAIGAMDVVYRSARRLVILLEDVQLDATEQKAAEMYAGCYKNMEQLIIKNSIQCEAKTKFMRSNKYLTGFNDELDMEAAQKLWEDARQFLKKLLTARWFSRAWCAHERRIVGCPVKENTPILFCFGANGGAIPFEFRFIQYHALRLFIAEEATHPILKPDFDGTSWIRHLYLRIHLLQSEPVDLEISLMQYLESIIRLDCSKKGDMVSIALNTARLPLVYSGHANTGEEVIWIMALLTIASGDIQPLVMDGTKLRIPDNDGTRTITSWVERPIVLKIPSSKRILHIDKHSITAITREYIELDILLSTDLPEKPSQASMEKSSVLVKTHFLKELNRSISTGGSEEAQDAHHFLQGNSISHDFIQTWLALVLDCGIEWIKRLPSELIEQTAGWSWGQITANSLLPVFQDKLAAAAIDLLHLAGKNEENTPDFTLTYLGPTIKFLECLIDSRLKMLTELPRRLSLGNSDWAITRRVTNKSWIAVPTAAAHLPLLQNKAWVIEAFDPAASLERPEDHWPPDLPKVRDPNAVQEDIGPVLTSDNASRRAPRNDERATWRMRRKQIIFGCRSIVPDGKSVILLKKQKMYGAEEYDWKAILSARYGDRGARV